MGSIIVYQKLGIIAKRQKVLAALESRLREQSKNFECEESYRENDAWSCYGISMLDCKSDASQNFRVYKNYLGYC